jgi:hypothetical protein
VSLLFSSFFLETASYYIVQATLELLIFLPPPSEYWDYRHESPLLAIAVSPKGPCVEGLAASLWCYWQVVEPSGGGAWWKEVRSLEAALEVDLGTLAPLSFLFASWFPQGEQFLCQVLPTRMYSLTPGPKAIVPTDLRLKPLKL